MKSALDFIIDCWFLILIPVLLIILSYPLVLVWDSDATNPESKWLIWGLVLIGFYVMQVIFYLESKEI